jgi:hypothetical protein
MIMPYCRARYCGLDGTGVGRGAAVSDSTPVRSWANLMETKTGRPDGLPVVDPIEEGGRLLAWFGRRRNWSGLGAGENRVGARGADVEHGQAEGGDHEDDRRPGGEPGEYVGRGAGAECGLRALAAECACQVSRTALLKQNHPDEKQAYDYVNHDDEIKKNLHCEAAFCRPVG